MGNETQIPFGNDKKEGVDWMGTVAVAERNPGLKSETSGSRLLLWWSGFEKDFYGALKLVVCVGFGFAEGAVDFNIDGARVELHLLAAEVFYADEGEAECGAIEDGGAAGEDDPAGGGFSDDFAEGEGAVAFGEIFCV